MENDVPPISLWEAIKQYGAGYGAVIVLTILFIYLVIPPDVRNSDEVVGFIFGVLIGILFIPFLFAWLGKSDTPKRRFFLFLGLWVIAIVLVGIGVFVA